MTRCRKCDEEIYQKPGSTKWRHRSDGQSIRIDRDGDGDPIGFHRADPPQVSV